MDKQEDAIINIKPVEIGERSLMDKIVSFLPKVIVYKLEEDCIAETLRELEEMENINKL